jgi:uncharacterized protein
MSGVSGAGPRGGASRGGSTPRVSAPGGGRPGSIRFTVRLTPRGGSDRIDGVSDEGVLLARVAAPPVEGAANEALVKLIARELDVAPSSVRIVSGATGRFKQVAVSGVEPEVLARRWPGLGG